MEGLHFADLLAVAEAVVAHEVLAGVVHDCDVDWEITHSAKLHSHCAYFILLNKGLHSLCPDCGRTSVPSRRAGNTGNGEDTLK